MRNNLNGRIPAEMMWRSQLCREWAKQQCPWGIKCRFAHGERMLNTLVILDDHSRNMQMNHSMNNNQNDNNKSSNPRNPAHHKLPISSHHTNVISTMTSNASKNPTDIHKESRISSTIHSTRKNSPASHQKKPKLKDYKKKMHVCMKELPNINN